MTETTDTATTEGVASIAEMLLSLARPAGPTTDEPDEADEATAAAEAARAAIEAERSAARAGGRVHHESIEWGGQVESFSRKRIAFLAQLRAMRHVVTHTDGPSDPAAVSAVIGRHIRAVDAMDIPGLDGDDWCRLFRVPGRGRWDDEALIVWAMDAVSHPSRLSELRDEATALRALRSASRAFARCDGRAAKTITRNEALRGELRGELGAAAVDTLAGPTAPVAPTPDSAATAVKSSGARRPARKAATAS